LRYPDPEERFPRTMSHRRAYTLPVSDRAEIIRQSEIGPSLDEGTLVRLAETSKAFDFRRRRFVYREGEVADSLYVIAWGRVKLCSIDEPTEREAVIDIVGAGALFGESSLYSAGVRERCAIAYEQARLLRIPAGVYREGMAASHELYDYTFRMVGQRLARAERRVVDFALDAIPARLDKLLAELSLRYGREEEGGVLIDLALPHREIASIVGSTRESVTVRLNAMRRAGIIDFVDRKILIKTPAVIVAV
jgi:CRP/FNR family transcriptional regulator